MRTARRVPIVALLLLGLLVRAAGPAGGQTPTATISGNAYTFNVGTQIAGATIRVVEFPDVSTTTAADGSYSLTFPLGSEVTLYIEAEGFDTIHLQTFTLDDDHEGTAIEGANFQTPTNAVYDALRALLTSYLGRDPIEDGCVIVTTVGVPELEGMPFEEFVGFAPHGVEGATATISPAATDPIYFNSSVVPDLNQPHTSDDGGVLWANVPPGDYRLSATHPDVDFLTADVRCEMGRVVNANPVWGLRGIDPTATTTTTTAATTTTDAGTTTSTGPTTTLATTTSVPTASTSVAPSTTAAVAGDAAATRTTTAVRDGRTAGRSTSGTLARTGTDARRTASWGAALLLVGTAIVAVERRRRTSAR